MPKLNLVLGVAHNFNSHEKSFVKKFKTLELKGTYPKIPNGKDFIYHSNLSATLDEMVFALKKEFRNYKRYPKIRRFSFDIGPCYSSVFLKDHKYFPSKNSQYLSKKKIFKMLKTQIKKLRKFLGNKCELAIENLNFYKTPAYNYVCEPKLYNEVSKKFNTTLVLDLAHLKISAINMGRSFDDVLRDIDHRFVKEIHLCKIAMVNNSPMDVHKPPGLSEFKDLEKALRINPNKKIDIVIEHWKNIKKLKKSYSDLNKYFKSKKF